jgi:antitoxin component YwqK of YwqJK toxin-antitoxin module
LQANRETGNILAKKYFFNGSQQGLTTYYRPDGTINSTSMHVDGKLHGFFIVYDDTGTTWEAWHHGVKHGKSMSWYPNGGRKGESTFVHGYPRCRKTWDENGNRTQ